jgi:carbon storage regulator
MLALTRKTDESVFLDGGRIKVTVLWIRGDRVRLGFNAPQDCRIDREEVHLARQRTTEVELGEEETSSAADDAADV